MWICDRGVCKLLAKVANVNVRFCGNLTPAYPALWDIPSCGSGADQVQSAFLNFPPLGQSCALKVGASVATLTAMTPQVAGLRRPAHLFPLTLHRLQASLDLASDPQGYSGQKAQIKSDYGPHCPEYFTRPEHSQRLTLLKMSSTQPLL